MCLYFSANIYSIPERKKQNRKKKNEKRKPKQNSSLQRFPFLSRIPYAAFVLAEIRKEHLEILLPPPVCF